MSNAPLLRLVNPETGEVTEEACRHCKVKEDEIGGLQRDIRGWAKRYADLKRDKDQEAHDHNLFPLAERCFRYWKRACNHPRSKFTPDRFWAVVPFLSDTEHYGLEFVLRAIAGAAFDPYETQRKNGTMKAHNGFDNLVFRDAEKAEEFAERAPPTWKMPKGAIDVLQPPDSTL